MSGWIKMHRSMMNHWCSSDPNFLAVWLRLLFDANFEDKKSLINGTIVEIKRGQVLFGLPSFAKRSGVTISKLRRVIKVLSDEHMIDRQTTNKYSIISITKYDQYQMIDRQNTNKTQTKHKQNTTSKEINNIRKKEKKDIGGKFEEFLEAYPERKGANPKKPAMTKFEKICLTVDPDILINAARQYASEESENIGTPYIAQAITWLNQSRWEQYQLEDGNRKAWEKKLEYFKKGQWIEEWGSKPACNGWKQSNHGECPNDLEIQFLAVVGFGSNEGVSKC